MPAVETLGSSSVICSDKTGTLTQNKMQVTKIVNYQGEVTNGELTKKILELGAMCTDVEISEVSKELTGEPTEVAIVDRALKESINKQDLYQIMKRIDDIPFDSNRKMMTTIHKMPSGYRIITKGAPDVLLKHCTGVHENGKIISLTSNLLAQIERQNIA